MKDILKAALIVVAIFGVIYVLGILGEKEPECQVCGSKKPLTECPVCHAEVCKSCADPDCYIEGLYDSGKMQEYLEDRGYLVYDDWNDVIALMMYNGIFDEVALDFGYSLPED